MQIAPQLLDFERNRVVRVHFLFRPVERVNGDYIVLDTIIPGELVLGTDLRNKILNFKSATIICPDLIKAENTGEICVRFLLLGAPNFRGREIGILLQASIIEKIEIEESALEKFIYDDVFKLASEGR